MNESIRSEVSKLKSTLKLDELESQINTLLETNQGVFDDNAKIMVDLEVASDYIFELETKIYQTNVTSLELLKQLKDCETEIDALKTYIIDLKSRIAVYIPVKNDMTDKRLAEYINNYPERAKLKIMFMRESEGIYQFGTKRVYVRVDHEKINIRVGGGFLSIDEFLDQYTPAELEKLERKDPMKRFAEHVVV
jgi:oligoribonuclease NrnB/cAMP/cGMP phosphodiesterase (DHH superfamily)